MHSQPLSHCETLDFIARDLLPSICLKMQILTVNEPHNVVLLHCWSIVFHTMYDISFKSWHLGLHDIGNEHMHICRISQSTKDMLQEILMILTLFCLYVPFQYKKIWQKLLQKIKWCSFPPQCFVTPNAYSYFEYCCCIVLLGWSKVTSLLVLLQWLH